MSAVPYLCLKSQFQSTLVSLCWSTLKKGGYFCEQNFCFPLPQSLCSVFPSLTSILPGDSPPHSKVQKEVSKEENKAAYQCSGYGWVPQSPHLCTGGLCHFAAEHSLLRGECASGSSTLSLLPMGSLGSPHHCGPPPHPLEWWRPFWPRVLVCYIGPLSLVALMAGVASGCLPPRQVAGSQFAEWLSSTGAHHYPGSDYPTIRVLPLDHHCQSTCSVLTLLPKVAKRANTGSSSC